MTPHDKIRQQFVALGYPEARDWTDQQIEDASHRITEAISKMGLTTGEAVTAFRNLHGAMRSSAVRPDIPAEFPQNTHE